MNNAKLNIKEDKLIDNLNSQIEENIDGLMNNISTKLFEEFYKQEDHLSLIYIQDEANEIKAKEIAITGTTEFNESTKSINFSLSIEKEEELEALFYQNIGTGDTIPHSVLTNFIPEQEIKEEDYYKWYMAPTHGLDNLVNSLVNNYGYQLDGEI